MKLHANAALSLSKRRVLCRRVVEENWTPTSAAAAAEVSVRCAPKWVGRYRAEREFGLLDRSSAPATVANRTCERRVEAIAALRRLRLTGPEIAETPAMPLSTVSGTLTRIGMGTLGRLGSSRPSAMSASGPASWSMSTSRRSGASRAARDIAPPAASTISPPSPTSTGCGVAPLAGRSCTSPYRRLHPPGLRRGPGR
jgi:hypothetical protein